MRTAIGGTTSEHCSMKIQAFAGGLKRTPIETAGASIGMKLLVGTERKSDNMGETMWHKCSSNDTAGRMDVRIGWNGWDKAWQLRFDSYDFSEDKRAYTHTNSMLDIEYCPFCGEKLEAIDDE